MHHRFARARTIRLKLDELPRLSRLPRCPWCGTEQSLRSWDGHQKRCYKDCLSMCLEQISRRVAVWWSKEPLSEWDQDCDARQAEFLRQEYAEKEMELLAQTPPQPGYPHDGMPI